MEWGTLSIRVMEYIRKYRYVLLVVLAGALLMTIPDSKKTEPPLETAVPAESVPADLQSSLASILGKIEGAGKVEVLLTQKEGEQIVYQMDEDQAADTSSKEIRRETVLITGAERSEEGLIMQINPPVYLGAIILCQGADRADIRLSIVEAVMGVTGLTSDKITVLKMK